MSSVASVASVSSVPVFVQRQLRADVMKLGHDPVYDNRNGRAGLLRQIGDEETARQLAEEASYVVGLLDVLV